MTELYLSIMGIQAAIGGIAFAAFLVLQESVANAVGDNIARRLWRARPIVGSLVWLTINGIVCLVAALAIEARPDFLPRWDPGIDYLVATWPVGLAAVVSAVGATMLAAYALRRASRMTYPTHAITETLKTWTLEDLLAAQSVDAVRPVREAAIRALQRPRPDDFDQVTMDAAARAATLLAASPGRGGEAIAAARNRLFAPLAEEAMRSDRADQAASVSGAAVELLRAVPSLDLAGRAQALEVCEGVRDLLLASPNDRRDIRRALTAVTGHLYSAAMLAIDARSGEAFDDACWAWLPIAKANPVRFLERDGVIDIGSGDDGDRPIETLVVLLGRAQDAMWGPAGAELINPRVWASVSGELALSLARWLSSKKGPNMDAEGLIVSVIEPVATMGIAMAARGRGDEASFAIDVIADIGRASRAKVMFSELPRDAAEWLAEIGMNAENSAATSLSGPVAAEAAEQIKRSLPTEIAYLTREIPMAGRFAYLGPPAHSSFLARLV